MAFKMALLYRAFDLGPSAIIAIEGKENMKALWIGKKHQEDKNIYCDFHIKKKWWHIIKAISNTDLWLSQ